MIGAAIAISCPAFAQVMEIGWAGVAPANMVGAPNNTTTAIGSATVSGWQSATNYNPFSFASFLGISVSALAQGDVIAFEHNGGGAPVGNFESSRWTMTNGIFTQVIIHDETVAAPLPGVVATGSMSQATYNAFFGISGTQSPVVSWIILDSALDVNDAGFTLNVSAGTTGEGTPDIDALGRICSCAVPEPSTLAAAGLGLIAIIRKRRNRK